MVRIYATYLFFAILNCPTTGRSCEKAGNDVPQGAPPPPPKTEPDIKDWTPYES